MVRPPSGPPAADEAVDRARLAMMREEVGEEALRRYAAAYLDRLWGRIDRLAEAARTRPDDDGLRAVFDLRVSSAMLGATRLAALTVEVEAALGTGQPIGAVRLRAVLSEAQAVVADLPLALTAVLTRPGSGGGVGRWQPPAGPPSP